jgi:hypothetical protein
VDQQVRSMVLEAPGRLVMREFDRHAALEVSPIRSRPRLTSDAAQALAPRRRHRSGTGGGAVAGIVRCADSRTSRYRAFLDRP